MTQRAGDVGCGQKGAEDAAKRYGMTCIFTALDQSSMQEPVHGLASAAAKPDGSAVGFMDPEAIQPPIGRVIAENRAA